MTNIPHQNEDTRIYDTDGYVLLMQTTQSNLSLFNVSCDSLIADEHDDRLPECELAWTRLKHCTSSLDIAADVKKTHHRSTMIFSDDILHTSTSPLQRWQGLELLNTCTS